MKKFILMILIISFVVNSNAQEEATKKEKIKSGWSFGAVPAIAYDTDLGLRYGGLVNFYHYGDGTIYPNYLHSIYLELSTTTKGSGIALFTYNSGILFEKIRINAEASLLTERALDFYGFNGYEAEYNAKYTDDDTSNTSYISRMYYRHERKLTRIKAELQGEIVENKLNWLGGIVHYENKIAPVDIEKLNEGKDSVDMLPDIPSLYDEYVKSGIIPDDQKNGGKTNLIKLGLVWDTRDNEPNPQTGLWEELILVLAPSFLWNDYAFTKLIITHRQYFKLIERKLSFAYRLSYQGKIAGEMPFYMLPYVYDSKITRNGIGGAKTLRGVIRNRIVGESMTYGTAELRWIFLRTVIKKQNLYIALSSFCDWGMVLKSYEYDDSDVPPGIDIVTGKEKLHLGYGGGLHFALNENFIVAVDYGLAADPRDGDTGLYIGLNWLF